MTPRTFWLFFLRFFGLYIIWQIVFLLPSFFAAWAYIDRSPDTSGSLTRVSAIVFIVLFFIAVLRACFFKTDWVIEKLHLTNNMPEEKIEIGIHRSNLLSITVIVLGGLMLADGLPILLFNIFQYFQSDNSSVPFTQNHSTPYIISYLAKVVIGYFMVADSRLIVNFIKRKRRKAHIATEEENSE